MKKLIAWFKSINKPDPWYMLCTIQCHTTITDYGNYRIDHAYYLYVSESGRRRIETAGFRDILTGSPWTHKMYMYRIKPWLDGFTSNEEIKQFAK